MKIEYVILHHSATVDGRTFSWDDIRRYHKSWAYKGHIISEEEAQNLINAGIKGVKRPWREIGYHFGIEQVDDGYEILMGRMIGQEGAHCVEHNMNKRSIGICFVGNYDIIEPPALMWLKGLDLVRWIMQYTKLPVSNIKGHRDFAPYKTCPGLMFDINKFRENVRERL